VPHRAIAPKARQDCSRRAPHSAAGRGEPGTNLGHEVLRGAPPLRTLLGENLPARAAAAEHQVIPVRLEAAHADPLRHAERLFHLARVGILALD